VILNKKLGFLQDIQSNNEAKSEVAITSYCSGSSQETATFGIKQGADLREGALLIAVFINFRTLRC
jgi:hypothetical protein